MGIEPLLTGFGVTTKRNTEWKIGDDEIIYGSGIRWSHVDNVTNLLIKCTKIKKINYDVSSYGLKHTIEKILGAYTSNGELIAAAIALEFKHKREYHGYFLSPNCYFNISKKSLQMLSNMPKSNTW